LLVRFSKRPDTGAVAVIVFLQNRSTQVYAGIVAFLVLSIIFAVVVTIPRQQAPAPPIDMPTRAQACRIEVHKALGLEKITSDVWDQVSNICYMQVRGEALLADFNIRRSNLINQQVEGRIVLWMVVAITISGVALAGLQLLAAYRLAGAGHGEFAASQEITLEQNRISLKSSVTGLMILVISFAFFMVYIVWVYTAKELKQESPEANQVAHGSVPPSSQSGTGGYGPIPSVPGSSGFGPPPAIVSPSPSTPPASSPPK
jgi:hypothetical protein